MKFQKAKEIYEKYLAVENIDPTLVSTDCSFSSDSLQSLSSIKLFCVLIFFFWHIWYFQVYIQYMKFARRSESIKESRAIFKRAREDSRTNFHVGIIKGVNVIT